jgi:hypothetical protein
MQRLRAPWNKQSCCAGWEIEILTTTRRHVFGAHHRPASTLDKVDKQETNSTSIRAPKLQNHSYSYAQEYIREISPALVRASVLRARTRTTCTCTAKRQNLPKILAHKCVRVATNLRSSCPIFIPFAVFMCFACRLPRIYWQYKLRRSKRNNAGAKATLSCVSGVL